MRKRFIHSQTLSAAELIFSRVFFLIVLLLAGLFQSNQANSAPATRVIAVDQQQLIELGTQGLSAEKHFKVLLYPRDSEPDDASVVNGLLDDQFKTLKRSSLGFSPFKAWIKIDIQNTGTSELDGLLFFPYISLDRITLFSKGDLQFHSKAGDMVKLEDRRTDNYMNSLPFAIGPASTQTYYIKVDTESALNLNLKLIEPRSYKHVEDWYILAGSFFFGGLVLMFFCNTGIAIATRRNDYYLYSFFIFVSFLREGFIQGFLQNFFLRDYMREVSYLGLMSFPFSNILVIWFAAEFLRLKKEHPIILKYFAIIALLNVFNMILYIDQGYKPYVGKLMMANIILTALSILAISWYKFYRGNREARYFALGWTISCLGFGLNALYASGVIPSGDSKMQIGLMGQFGEIILLSFAFAERINNMRTSRNKAQNDLSLQLRSFNDNLQVEVKEKTRAIRSILDNVSLGIMPLQLSDKKGEEGTCIIGADHSEYLSQIASEEVLAGKDPFLVFFSKTDISADSVSQIRSTVFGAIGEDPIQFELNRHHLPTSSILKTADGDKELSMDWSPVVNEQTDVIDRILLVLKDVTEIKKLELERKKHDRDMALVSRIVKINDVKYSEFIRLADNYLSEIENTFVQLEKLSFDAQISNFKPMVSRIYRVLHTTKGLSRTFDMTEMSDAVHNAESVCQEWQSSDQFDPYKISIFRSCLTLIHASLYEYKRINFDVLGRKRNSMISVDRAYIENAIRTLSAELEDENLDRLQIARVVLDFKKLYLKEVKTLISEDIKGLVNISLKLGKEAPEFHFQSDSTIFVKPEFESALRTVFIHSLRNSIDHGIEMPEERLAAGKSASGNINVNSHLSQDGKHFILEIQDDGRGLQMDRISHKALAMGLVTEEQMSRMTPQKIADLIFYPGFSTAADLSDMSGRGVGMDSIQKTIQEHGGKVDIVLKRGNSQSNFAFILRFTIPIKHMDTGRMSVGELQSAS